MPVSLQLKFLSDLVFECTMQFRAVGATSLPFSDDSLKPSPTAAICAMVHTIPAMALVFASKAKDNPLQRFDFNSGEWR